MRQKPPLTPRAGDVENGVEDLSAVILGGPPARGMIALDGRNEIDDEVPPLMRQIGVVRTAVRTRSMWCHTGISAYGFGIPI